MYLVILRTNSLLSRSVLAAFFTTPTKFKYYFPLGAIYCLALPIIFTFR